MFNLVAKRSNKMIKLLSTVRVSAVLIAMFVSFSVFHSPPASALISIICMGDPETGIISCTAKDEGGDGGGSCDVSICGGGGPAGGTGPRTVAWDDRSEPQCKNETDAIGALMTDIIRTVQGGAPIPGTLIMSGPFGDPTFSAPGWGKYRYGYIVRNTDKARGVVTQYSIQIHYMFNAINNDFNQVRLKSTASAGCVGTTTPIGI
jgi:hypothetical protein